MNKNKKIYKKTKRIFEKFAPIVEGGYFIWGLLFVGWSPIMIVIGYWIEEVVNLILTTFSLIILRIKGRKPIYLGKLLFFYGVFLFAHTVFVLILLGITSKENSIGKSFFEAFILWVTGHGFQLEGGLSHELIKISLVVTLGIIYSLYHSIFKKGKWKTINTGEIVNRSFSSIIAPHLIIIFGIGSIILFNAPGSLAIVLVIIKIIVDVAGFGEKGAQLIVTDENKNS